MAHNASFIYELSQHIICVPCKTKEDQAISAKKHYEANKDKLKAKAKAYSFQNRINLREIVRIAKDVPCTDCGVRYPTRVMDFDHVRGIKSSNVSNMVGRSVGINTLKTEIAKCDVVCSNCHRLRHIELENIAGQSSPVARQAHNLKVGGSNPSPATVVNSVRWFESSFRYFAGCVTTQSEHAITAYIADSYNGNTNGSEPFYRGSNPWSAS